MKERKFRVNFPGEDGRVIDNPEEGHVECPSDGVGGFFEISEDEVKYMHTLDSETQEAVSGRIPNSGDMVLVELLDGNIASVERLS